MDNEHSKFWNFFKKKDTNSIKFYSIKFYAVIILFGVASGFIRDNWDTIQSKYFPSSITKVKVENEIPKDTPVKNFWDSVNIDSTVRDFESFYLSYSNYNTFDCKQFEKVSLPFVDILDKWVNFQESGIGSANTYSVTSNVKESKPFSFEQKKFIQDNQRFVLNGIAIPCRLDKK